MRSLLVAVSLLFVSLQPVRAQAQVSAQIGIHVPTYPTLVQVPGYPVYYDPHLAANYFFYDGLYWVYSGDTWFASSWYNGPWQMVAPASVPLFVLRVPVRYYRRPPVYFSTWPANAPPRWGEHWGHDWEAHRAGWDHWDHHAVPRPAPLPVYQRQYAGARYPHAPEQQQAIRGEKYHYRPHDAVAQQHFQQPPKPVNSHVAGHPPQAPQPQKQAMRTSPEGHEHKNKAPPPHKGEEKKGEEHGPEHH